MKTTFTHGLFNSWTLQLINNNNNNNNNHNRPDITLVQKDTQEWTLIDIAVPADQNIINTEEEKVDRYQDLAFEIKRIHRASKVTVIPIITGALGTISKNAKSWHEKLKILDIVGSAQLSAILGTAHILRKCCVSELWEVAET